MEIIRFTQRMSKKLNKKFMNIMHKVDKIRGRRVVRNEIVNIFIDEGIDKYSKNVKELNDKLEG